MNSPDSHSIPPLTIYGGGGGSSKTPPRQKLTIIGLRKSLKHLLRRLDLTLDSVHPQITSRHPEITDIEATPTERSRATSRRITTHSRYQRQAHHCRLNPIAPLRSQNNHADGTLMPTRAHKALAPKTERHQEFVQEFVS